MQVHFKLNQAESVQCVKFLKSKADDAIYKYYNDSVQSIDSDFDKFSENLIKLQSMSEKMIEFKVECIEKI